ncbi:hypothetical protein ADK91_02890 [Streptomyces sp. XY511]|uniref:hypothetical protein n=1 Tax=Streptomyces sp. XY511 TaxID=1519480 RepID=UPI0006AFE3AE|nr:hypothetical protein [Streptomyces sp. XY511]KOV17258.1 hypothetical protein ADK91_02890 [Streptomyces sp. XY511]
MSAQALPATAAGRPRLYHVPAGLSLAERAAARADARGLRATWGYPGYDEASAERAGFNAGVAYGVWGVHSAVAERLGELAHHLTGHAQQAFNAHRFIVTAALIQREATVSVLALGGVPTLVVQPDPETNEHVRCLATGWSRIRLAAGPCISASCTI